MPYSSAFHESPRMIPRANTQPHPRIFLAVDVPNHARLALLSLTTVQIPAARIMVDDSYHVTLNFLGNTPIAPVARVARRVSVPAFDVSLSSVGAFPSNAVPYTLFAQACSQGLLTLQHQLTVALSDAGFQTDQRLYQPHVTLAKIPRRRDDSVQAAKIFLEENRDFAVEPFRVNEFVLMESVHTRRGEPHYIIRDRFPLEPEEDDIIATVLVSRSGRSLNLQAIPRSNWIVHVEQVSNVDTHADNGLFIWPTTVSVDAVDRSSSVHQMLQYIIMSETPG